MTGPEFERALYTLRSAGFAILRGFFPDPFIARLREAALAFETEIDAFAASGGDLPYKAGWPLKNARCLFAVDKVFEALVMETGLIELARGYLGRPRVRDIHLLVNSPDPVNAKKSVHDPVNWHRDKVWAEGEAIVPSYLHSFVLITEMTETNGGTLIVPGTHREREPNYYFLEKDPGVAVEGNYYKVYPQDYFPARVQVVAPRGSLVLIDPMAIHAQGINVTGVRRIAVNATFHRDGLKGIIDCAGIHGRHARYKASPGFVDLLAAEENGVKAYGPLA